MGADAKVGPRIVAREVTMSWIDPPALRSAAGDHCHFRAERVPSSERGIDRPNTEPMPGFWRDVAIKSRAAADGGGDEVKVTIVIEITTGERAEHGGR